MDNKNNSSKIWISENNFVYLYQILKPRYMKDLGLIKEFIEIDGEKYFHYLFGGKYTCTKFIVINGIHYYNSNKPSQDQMTVG